MAPAILIIEDERRLARQLSRALTAEPHDVRTAESGAEGLSAARSDPPDLVLLDLRLPDGSGLDVLTELLRLDPGLPVVLMTAYGSVRQAVEAIRLGAADYLQKPLDLDELGLLVKRVLANQRRDRELAYLRDRDRTLPQGVVGNDLGLLEIFAQAERLREADLPPEKRPTLLLTGETGTGKGVLARAIHEILGGGPFMEVNCTAMPPSLIEAELFGYERGTFTDARTSRAGLVEAAEGGTLFLDEIGDLQIDLQAKFLKLIEERRVRRLGSTRDRAVGVHVMAATHRDLERGVREGTFRADLLHRLRVLSFAIPPLRERGDDVRLLARHFCSEFGIQYEGVPRQLSAEAEEHLARYPWPGNVRELRNVLERAILLDRDDPLSPAVVQRLLHTRETSAATGSRSFTLPAEGIDLASLERGLIREALDHTRGNRTRAAILLGLTRDTLRYRIEKHGID